MKVIAVAFLVACCSLVMGKEEAAEKEKRGVSYTTPRTYSTATAADVAYATAKVSPQTFAPNAKEYTQPQYQVKYVQTAQQQSAPVQYQYDYEQQPYAAAANQQPQQHQQQVTKLAPAKAAYAPAPVHFSLASDVSTFSYSSPLVSYSNLGLLKQTIGKGVGVEQPTAEQSYSQPQYSTDTKVAYAPQQYVSYKQPQKVLVQSAPAQQKLTYTAPAHTQKLSYAQPAQPAQRIVYAQVAQPQAQHQHQQAAPSQQAYKAGSTIVYASSAEEAYEKIYGKPYVAPQQQAQTYEAQPQYQHQAQAPSQAAPAYQGQQQVQYVKLTPQQYAAYTQQLQQHQQQPQYVDAPQYAGSHSEQQPTYVTRPQFYQKYATPGVTYTHAQ